MSIIRPGVKGSGQGSPNAFREREYAKEEGAKETDAQSRTQEESWGAETHEEGECKEQAHNPQTGRESETASGAGEEARVGEESWIVDAGAGCEGVQSRSRQLQDRPLVPQRGAQ